MDGVARKCKSLYIGVDGVARKVKSGYIGVDGVARKFFSSGKPLNEFAEGDIVYINEEGSPGSMQWTRSPDTSGNNSVYFVTIRGTVSSTSSLSVAGNGTRPAFTLPADTPVNEDTLVVLG